MCSHSSDVVVKEIGQALASKAGTFNGSYGTLNLPFSVAPRSVCHRQVFHLWTVEGHCRLRRHLHATSYIMYPSTSVFSSNPGCGFFGHSIPDYLESKEKDFHGIISPRLTTFVFSFVACLYLLLICDVTHVQTLRELYYTYMYSEQGKLWMDEEYHEWHISISITNVLEVCKLQHFVV